MAASDGETFTSIIEALHRSYGEQISMINSNLKSNMNWLNALTIDFAKTIDLSIEGSIAPLSDITSSINKPISKIQSILNDATSISDTRASKKRKSDVINETDSNTEEEPTHKKAKSLIENCNEDIDVEMNSDGTVHHKEEGEEEPIEENNIEPVIDISNFLVKELRAMLKERNLKVGGKKSELIDRLNTALALESKEAIEKNNSNDDHDADDSDDDEMEVEVDETEDIKSKSVIHIQRVIRGYLARTLVAKKRNKHMKELMQNLETRASVTIQCCYRGYRSRNYVMSIRQELKAIIVLQCAVRTYTAKRALKILKQEKKRYNACKLLQRIYRGRSARIKVREIRRLKLEQETKLRKLKEEQRLKEERDALEAQELARKAIEVRQAAQRERERIMREKIDREQQLQREKEKKEAETREEQIKRQKEERLKAFKEQQQRNDAIQKEKDIHQQEKERLRAEAVQAEAELFRKMAKQRALSKPVTTSFKTKSEDPESKNLSSSSSHPSFETTSTSSNKESSSKNITDDDTHAVKEVNNSEDVAAPSSSNVLSTSTSGKKAPRNLVNSFQSFTSFFTSSSNNVPAKSSAPPVKALEIAKRLREKENEKNQNSTTTSQYDNLTAQERKELALKEKMKQAKGAREERERKQQERLANIKAKEALKRQMTMKKHNNITSSTSSSSAATGTSSSNINNNNSSSNPSSLDSNTHSNIPTNSKTDFSERVSSKPTNTLQSTSTTTTTSTADITPMKSPTKKEYYWKPPAKTPDQYEMTANDFSDDDSGEDGVVPERNIPSWAKGDELEAALDRQFGRDMGSGIDPDDIFGPVSSIDLEVVFSDIADAKQKMKYKQRNSTANWSRDALTIEEIKTYREQTGLGNRK